MFGRGLNELLEYIEYAQRGGHYLDDMNVPVEGFLITDGVNAAAEVERCNTKLPLN